jgi:hypothetical protein
MSEYIDFWLAKLLVEALPLVVFLGIMVVLLIVGLIQNIGSGGKER